jgi:hypothetical protein
VIRHPQTQETQRPHKHTDTKAHVGDKTATNTGNTMAAHKHTDTKANVGDKTATNTGNTMAAQTHRHKSTRWYRNEVNIEIK